MMSSADAIERLCRTLPEWAQYYVRLGAGIAAVEPELTVLVTAPRRECVSGLVAVGTVLALEDQLWTRLKAHPDQDLGAGDPVAVVAEPWCIAGTVTVVTGTTLKVETRDSRRTYEGEQRCAVVPRRGSGQSRERVPDAFAALWHVVFEDRFRACSFVLREIRGCTVLGLSGMLTEEWRQAELARHGDSVLTIRDVLRPERGDTLQGTHVELVSDRSDRQTHSLPPRDLIRVVDGHRAWVQTRRGGGRCRTIVVVDRSDDRFYDDVRHAVSEDMVTFDPFGNIPEPPRGIETFAYREHAYTEW